MLKAKIERKLSSKKSKNRDFSNCGSTILTKFGEMLGDLPADDCANFCKNSVRGTMAGDRQRNFFVGG